MSIKYTGENTLEKEMEHLKKLVKLKIIKQSAIDRAKKVIESGHSVIYTWNGMEYTKAKKGTKLNAV